MAARKAKKKVTKKKASKKKASSKKKKASKKTTAKKKTSKKTASKETAGKKKVVVAGDICLDWLMVPTAKFAGEGAFNWQLYPGTRQAVQPGGAALLAQMVEQATDATVASRQLGDLESIAPDDLLRSTAELGAFGSNPDGKVWRVKRFCGFAGTSDLTARAVEGDLPKADVVVLDDGGNGFRETPRAWPRAVKNQKPLVLLKMSRPLARGKLWDQLRKEHADRLVVVINADDLRQRGANISRGLSWERTAKDLVWQMACNPDLLALGNCSHLVVRFGIDGAAHYTRHAGEVETRLYYDPTTIEGSFAEGSAGAMQGINTVFCTGIVRRLLEGGLAALGDGIADGIRASRRLLVRGFGPASGAPAYPGGELFDPPTAKEAPITNVVVPPPAYADRSDPTYWCILEDAAGRRIEEFASNLVLMGKAPAMRGVPVGAFKALRTIDRTEIESYRAIRNLMREYLATPSPKRPLSVAVFGPPGAGKSFGVTQVANSVAPGQIVKLEFNISQFTKSADLIPALHEVRDVSLAGKVPLVFFDEFDAAAGDVTLAWLKDFLAPMQDGAFKDGDAVHPIGRAIFVFAGGTSSTYAHFAGEGEDDPERALRFRGAKGPDFVSRLRGYINILGPNPVDDNDRLYMIRRAILLRVLLQMNVKHLFDEKGCALIDPGVLRAMLKVPRYKHGVRSIEALIDMSMLAGRKSFEQSALPPKAQLELHVDADVFARLVARDVLLGAVREKIAEAIHNNHLRLHAKHRRKSDPSMKKWGKLNKQLQESNRQQADQIPEKLHRVGYGFAPAADGAEIELVEFSAEEVEVLAEMEHARWIKERRLQGWSLGPKDVEKRISPYLVGWEDLEDNVKEWDREPVRQIPALLADAGFEIYRF